VATRRTKKPAKPETHARERRREEEEDVVRDLEASLAHDPNATTRAKRLEQLRDMPRTPMHPLALYLAERGVSRTQAEELLGLRRIEIDHAIRDWKRPKDAAFIADALGLDVDDLFPETPPEA
jgi:hypothetical protein